MRKLVYISAPFTAASRQLEAVNSARAADQGRAVRAMGATPLVPHVAVLPPLSQDSEAVWNEAMLDCLALLARCDAMLLLPGWEPSRGCKVELDMAREWGIPVYQSLADLRDAVERAA